MGEQPFPYLTHHLDTIYVYQLLLKHLKGYKSYGVNKVSPLKFIQGRYNSKRMQGKVTIFVVDTLY